MRFAMSVGRRSSTISKLSLPFSAPDAFVNRKDLMQVTGFLSFPIYPCFDPVSERDEKEGSPTGKIWDRHRTSLSCFERRAGPGCVHEAIGSDHANRRVEIVPRPISFCLECFDAYLDPTLFWNGGSFDRHRNDTPCSTYCSRSLEDDTCAVNHASFPSNDGDEASPDVLGVLNVDIGFEWKSNLNFVVGSKPMLAISRSYTSKAAPATRCTSLPESSDSNSSIFFTVLMLEGSFRVSQIAHW